MGQSGILLGVGSAPPTTGRSVFGVFFEELAFGLGLIPSLLPRLHHILLEAWYRGFEQ